MDYYCFSYDYLAVEFSAVKTNQTIMDMYLACHSQEEIAAAVDLTRQAITQKIDDYANFGNLAKNCKTLANHEINNDLFWPDRADNGNQGGHHHI